MGVYLCMCVCIFACVLCVCVCVCVWMADSASPKMWAQEKVRKEDIEVVEDVWYEEANKSRPGWKALCRRGIKSRVVSVQVVNRCGRTFRRESDNKRHKCRREGETSVGATWSHSVWDMQEVVP